MSPRTYIDPEDNDWVSEKLHQKKLMKETIQQWEQYEKDGNEASKQE